MKSAKSIAALLILLASLLQAGCAFKDIDKRLFVSAIGIDPAENIEKGFKVTLKVALPFGAIKESSKPSYAYLTKEGESVGEVIRLLGTHVDKVLEFGHMKTIVINEELMEDGIELFMDYFVRRGDIQMIAYVAAAKPSAETILKVEPATEAPASVSLFNLFGDTGLTSPFVITTFLFQFRREFLADGISVTVPIIRTDKDRQELIVNTAVVVDREHKIVEMNDVETKYFNTLFRGASGFTYKVEEGEDRFLLNISRIKMDYKIKTKNTIPKAIEMDIRMVGSIGEANHPLSLAKLDEYNDISSRAIEDKVRKLLTDMQEHGVDPFGFGLRYRATHLAREGLLAAWKDAYKDLSFQVNVDMRLQGTGTIE